MFIDRAKVELRAGNGGNGAIAFHTEKFIDKGGPSGGNGGRGGSIIFVARKSSSTLINFRHSKVIIAKDGEKGMAKNMYGRAAEDVYVEVPIGTVIYLEPEHKFICDLDEEGKTYIVAKGGRGGRGNACFKSPTNRVPRIAENGLPGDKMKITLELKLLADVGFVGLPSVGKSTLLSVISAAKPEIADYPFTTIVPNLGVVNLQDGRSFVAADLPGLIEGAHQGKGLGLQFLRHIERCRVITHVVEMGGDRNPYEDYKMINKELESYGFNLLKRPMLVACSKMDEDEAEMRFKTFKKKMKGVELFPISALTHEGIDALLYRAADLLDVTEPFPIYNEEGAQADIKVYDSSKDLEQDVFDIIKTGANKFVIKGERVERTYHLINLSTDEGMMRLIAYLRKIGVDDRLRKMNAQDGDTVVLCDFEFEYFS